MNINYTGPGTNLPSYNKQDRVDLFYDYKYFCKLNIYYNPSKFQFVPNYSKSCHEKTYNYYTIFYLLFLQKTIALVMGNEFYIEKLKQMLKTQFGRDMETPADFSDLSDDIRDKLKCNTMSATTLKRLFGYIKYDKEISLSSLSLLARYLGYSGWNAFCMNDKSESGFISEEIIYSKNLIKGDSVLFEWNPNRSCVAEFLGNDRFLVKNAQYCKLEIGDTFTTTQFILNNPLIITDLIQVRMPGEPPKKYVAGSKSGLTRLRKAKKNK